MRPSRQLIDGANRWQYGTCWPGGSEATAFWQPEVKLENVGGLALQDQAHVTTHAETNPFFTYDPKRRRFVWVYFYNDFGPLYTQSNFVTLQTFSIDTALYAPEVIPPLTLNHNQCTWDAATVYAIGDTVTFQGQAYIASAAGSGHRPGIAPQWTLHNWDVAKAYPVGGVAGTISAYSTHICLIANTGRDPATNPIYWTPVMETADLQGIRVFDSGKIAIFYIRRIDNLNPYNSDLYVAIYDPATNTITNRAILISTDAPAGTEPTFTAYVNLLGSGASGDTIDIFYAANLMDNTSGANTVASVSHRILAPDGTLGAITILPCGETGADTGIIAERGTFFGGGYASNQSPSLQNVYRRGNRIITSANWGNRTAGTAAPALIIGTPADAPVWTVETVTAPRPLTSLIETVVTPAVDPFPPAPAWVTFGSSAFGLAPFGYSQPNYDERDFLAWMIGPYPLPGTAWFTKGQLRNTDGTWSRLYSLDSGPYDYLWPLNDTRAARIWYLPQGPGLYASYSSAAANDDFYEPFLMLVRQGMTGCPQAFFGATSYPAAT